VRIKVETRHFVEVAQRSGVFVTENLIVMMSRQYVDFHG